MGKGTETTGMQRHNGSEILPCGDERIEMDLSSVAGSGHCLAGK